VRRDGVNREPDGRNRLTEDDTHGDSPLRVGVVGLGKVGAIRCQLIQNHPHLELVAVCDIDPDREAPSPDVPFVVDLSEFERHDLDVVFVCVYNVAAPGIVDRQLRLGRHVFCEKPPGRNVADVERVIEAERVHDHTRLKFGFNHRYHYVVQEADALVKGGRYGEVLWARGIYGKCGGVEFEDSWRNDSKTAGGGILLDQGIHMVDLLRLFCGEFTEIKSVVTRSFWDIPVEDNAFAIMSTENGRVALLHSSATQWKHRFSLELCLQGGYININGILSSTRSYGQESLTFARRQFEDETFAFGNPREETVFFDRDDSWTLEVDDFVSAIRNGLPVETGSSSDALATMKLVERIYAEGGWRPVRSAP
jgi:predicted dehydrogenase